MSIIGESWSDLKPKGKVCVALLLPLAIAMVAVAAHTALAKKGCAPVVGFWGHVGVGAQALVIGLFLACVVAGLLRLILGIPEISAAAKQEIARRRQSREWEIEHYGHVIDKMDWGPVLAILAIALALGAVVILFGGGIGYIAWLLSC